MRRHISESMPRGLEAAALMISGEKLNTWIFLSGVFDRNQCAGDRDQWQSRTDSGWDEFDVTIFGDRFSKVVVKTVSENHGGEKRLLRARLDAGWTLRGKISLFVSIGIAEWSGAAEEASHFIARADAALYEAKLQGRNRVVAAAPGGWPGLPAAS